MGKLTLDSTFKDIRELLQNDDELFNRQCVYLCGSDFSNETDKGYLVQNFHFFMAIVLGGVAYRYLYQKKFLNLAYQNRQNQNTTSAWEQGVKNFIYGKRDDISNEMRIGIKSLSENLSLRFFYDGSWIDLSDENGRPIFKDANGQYIFKDREDKKTKKVVIGEIRAKEKMKQIVDFLVNGTQITSNGGFSYMADPYTLLKANRQLILNGAPGTGKTYSARSEIADRLFEISGSTDEEKGKVKRIRMDMVQFHPSYDYTDFIEGIRPDMQSGNIGYTLKNGSFKSFCRRAGVIERIVAAERKVDDATIDEFLVGEDKAIKDFWKAEIKKESFDINNLPPFLFIIDEINRAEISKVLGEIMFCLDADYRGAKGMIATQYSSLATDESFFISTENDKFFIPSNVYIIGTMNDIDRSVEVFDFALRRRFAWHEVTADSVMETVLKAMRIDEALGDDYSDYIERIKVLNASIESSLKLNRHYYLGPSYFAKISLYLKESSYKAAREEVWNNHIAQILNEYVKGKKTENEVDKIGDVFKA